MRGGGKIGGTAVAAVIVIVLLLLICCLLAYKLHLMKQQQEWQRGSDAVAAKKTPSYENTDFTLDNLNIYVINMSKVKDRFDHFMKQYRVSDLSSQRFFRLEAINGRELPRLDNYISQKAKDEILMGEQSGHRTKHYQLTRGAVGCYLSHMMIYKHMLQSNRYNALIFEDDVIFGPDIFYETQQLLRGVPADWDIVLLGCHCIKCDKDKGSDAAVPYTKIYRFFFLHGVVINQKGANAILNYIDDIKIEQQIDSVLSDMAEKHLINIYCARQSIAKQSHEFKTQIQIPLKKMKGIDPYAPAVADVV